MRRIFATSVSQRLTSSFAQFACKSLIASKNITTNNADETIKSNEVFGEKQTSNIAEPTEEIVITVQEEQVKVSHDPIDKFVPDLSENPELLTGEEKTKSIFIPEQLQVFTASAVVGAATALFLYFVIVRNLKNASQQQELEIELAGRQLEHSFDKALASSESSSKLPEFAAPSSYAELRRSMLEQQKRMQEEEERIRRSTSFLHTELMYRLKRWWNQSLANVQHAVAQEARRESRTPARITSALRVNGFNVVDLKRIDKIAHELDV